jgi:hypothetical protein
VEGILFLAPKLLVFNQKQLGPARRGGACMAAGSELQPFIY